MSFWTSATSQDRKFLPIFPTLPPNACGMVWTSHDSPYPLNTCAVVFGLACTGNTNVKGLYVVGEVAYTGLHGANRLASNSLLEALLLLETDPCLAAKWACPVLPISIRDSTLSGIIERTRKTRMELQSIMWEYVGIVRSTNRLKNVEWKIGDLKSEWEEFLFRRGWKPNTVGIEACEMRNLLCCVKLVMKNALARWESRGLHFTEDFPYLEESKRKPTVTFPTAIQELIWSSKPLQRQLQYKWLAIPRP